MKTNSRRSQRGYTLVEILAVVAIIMALTGIFIVAIRSSLQKGRVANVMGTAQAISTAVADFLQKPGSSGVVPLTEGSIPFYNGTSVNRAYADAPSLAASILDTILLTEGALEKPLSVRMGPTQNLTDAGTVPLPWNVSKQAFEAPGSGTLADYSSTTHLESAMAAVAPSFRVDGTNIISPAYRVIYLTIPNVAITDAYALALQANGAAMLSSEPTAVVDEETAATNGVTRGPVMFAPAGADGTTTVYYFITKQ